MNLINEQKKKASVNYKKFLKNYKFKINLK